MTMNEAILQFITRQVNKQQLISASQKRISERLSESYDNLQKLIIEAGIELIDKGSKPGVIMSRIDDLITEFNIPESIRSAIKEELKASFDYQKRMYSIIPEGEQVDLTKAHRLSLIKAEGLIVKDKAKITDDLLFESVNLISTAKNRDSLIQLLTEKANSNFYKAESLAQTLISVYDNTLSNNTADQAGLEAWKYFGGLIEHSRTFCIKQIKLAESGKVYTVDEVRKLDNEQGLPVESSCGGYRCIHQWLRGKRDWFNKPEVIQLTLFDDRDEVSKKWFNGKFKSVKIDKDSHILVREMFGKSIDKYELARLTGAPDQSEIEIRSIFKTLYIDVRHPFINNMMRTLKLNPNTGAVILENYVFKTVKDGTVPSNLAGRVLYKEMNQARKLGINTVITHGVGDNGIRNSWNGYYTWPRYGFNAKIPTESMRQIRRIDESEFADKQEFDQIMTATSILDLMKTEKGRKIWQLFGQDVHLTFDTDPKSSNYKTLVAYLHEKGIRL